MKDRRTAEQARDEAREAGRPTRDEALGFPSAATFGGARGAARDARGRLYRRVRADEWAFKLPPARGGRAPTPPPEPGERLELQGRPYVVLELLTAPAARKLTGLVALRCTADD